MHGAPPSLDELVDVVQATVRAHGAVGRDERVRALADALRARLRACEPGERRALLDALGERFPRTNAAAVGTSPPVADPAAQQRIEELERELATLRAERAREPERTSTPPSGEALEFLIAQATSGNAPSPVPPQDLDADALLRECFQIMVRILEVLGSNVNDSMTFVEAQAPPIQVRQSLARALESGDPASFEEDLKRLRRCLRTLISQPFVFLQNWCRDMQEQFLPQNFLDRCRNKPAKAFEEFEDFMARTQFVHAVFPPLKATLRSKLLEILRTPGTQPPPRAEPEDLDRPSPD